MGGCSDRYKGEFRAICVLLLRFMSSSTILGAYIYNRVIRKKKKIECMGLAGSQLLWV